MSRSFSNFKEMVESSQDWFWEFDENANFTYVSPRIKDLLGYDPEEILGKNAFELMSADEAQRVHEHFDPIAQKYHPFNNLENINIHKNGHEVVIESSGVPIFDDNGDFKGYRGIDRDITQRKIMEATLSESESQFQTIIETSSEWVWEIDLNGKHIFSNHRLMDMLGYLPDELIGRDYRDYLHEDDLQQVIETLPKYITEKRGWRNWVLRWRHADGSYRYLESNAQPVLSPNGEIKGFRGADRDITERKLNELALQAATHSAEAAITAKSLFLAKLSHEIRTPLTAVVGYAELLGDTELDELQKSYLQAIVSSGNTLTSLAEDVLDLSKIEDGKLLLKFNDFCLSKLINKFLEISKSQADAKGLSLSFNVEDNVPELLNGDERRIQQVLLNLVRNAIKFTDKGSITVTVSVAEINKSRVLLDVAVKDTGVGIPEIHHKDIFEPFVQVLEDNVHSLTGSGLGLSISLSLATLMGGSLRVESQTGLGSTFHLLLPLTWKQEHAHEDSSCLDDSVQWNGPKLRVLLAEDNQVNAKYISTVLKKMGHTVHIVNNGRDVLTLLNDAPIDLILMDINMPVLSGSDALKMIRAGEQKSKTNRVVIALTAYAVLGDREKYLQMGFDGYISKPFTTEQLVIELMHVCLRYQL